MSRKTSQKGFALVEALLAVIALSLIVFVGFYVWHSTKHETVSKTASDTTAKATQKPSSTGTAPASSHDALVIKEWGIEISLTGNTRDAYYAVRSDDVAVVDLSTYSLAKLDSFCAADKSSSAAITYFTNPNATDEMTGKSNLETHPDAVKIDGKYYYITPANGACSSDQAAMDKQLQVRSDFQHATIKPAG